MGTETAAPPQCLCHRRPYIGAQKWIKGANGNCGGPNSSNTAESSINVHENKQAARHGTTANKYMQACSCTREARPQPRPQPRGASRQRRAPNPLRPASTSARPRRTRTEHGAANTLPAATAAVHQTRQRSKHGARQRRPSVSLRRASSANVQFLQYPPPAHMRTAHQLRQRAQRMGRGPKPNPSQPSSPPLPAQAARRLRRRGEHGAAVSQRRVRVRPGRRVRGGRRRGLAAAAQRRQRLRASQQRVAVVRVARQVLIVHLRGARASPLSAKRRSSGQGAPSGAHRDRRRLFAWRIFLGAAVGSAAGARHLHVRPSTTWTCGRLRGARPACASRALAHHEAQPHWSRRAWGRSRMAAAGPAEQGLQRPCERASETQRAARALGSRERAAGRACRAAAGWPARRSTAPRQSRTGANWRSGSM